MAVDKQCESAVVLRRQSRRHLWLGHLRLHHQVVAPGPELLEIRSTCRASLAPDGGVADGQCRVRDPSTGCLERFPVNEPGSHEAVPRN